MSKAGQRGVIAILDWYLMRAGTVVNKPYLSCALEEATKKGHIHVLHWMKENELQPSYIKQCWNVGAVCGQVHVLDWPDKNGYKIERQIVHKAAFLGNISVLEWCFAHGVKVKCCSILWWSIECFEVASAPWLSLGWQCNLLG